MLYHISLKFWRKIEMFSPRIPKGCLNGVNENNTIPRICLSDSVENCLTAASWGGSNLINDPPYKENELIAIARIYKFDCRKIKRKNLLLPCQIKKYVPDSLISHEHWVINQNISPKKSYVIILRDFFFDIKILEYEGRKYKVYKITRTKYDILTEEQDNLLISYLNSKNKESFTRKYINELYNILNKKS